MALVVYDTPDGVQEKQVEELKYKEDTDCWWFYLDDGSDGPRRARYIPRERVYRVDRGG